MREYLDLCQYILDNGAIKGDRTGTGTISIFGYQMRFDLSKGFPLLTTKDMSGSRIRAVIYELLWFLNGDTNIKYLVENGVNIWNPDAYRYFKEHYPDSPLTQKDFVELIKVSEYFARVEGNLGRIYGAQWRSWRTGRLEYPEGADYPREVVIDQINQVIEQIKKDPNSRRHLVTAWNPGELDQMALPPCHYAFQFYVAEGKLSCMFQMRSTDVFLGLPFNIASYALLTMMIAKLTGLEPGELIYTGGDVHIYLNHIEQVKTQLQREPKPLPKMVIHGNQKTIDDFKFEDFELIEYESHPPLKGKVSMGL